MFEHGGQWVDQGRPSNTNHMLQVENLRGLAFSEQQAGQGQFQPDLQHLAAGRLELQRHMMLTLSRTGKLLHVDVR